MIDKKDKVVVKRIDKPKRLNMMLVLVGCLWFFILFSIPFFYGVEQIAMFKTTHFLIEDLGGVPRDQLDGFSLSDFSMEPSERDNYVSDMALVGFYLYGPPGGCVGGVMGLTSGFVLCYSPDVLVIVFDLLGPLGRNIFNVSSSWFDAHVETVSNDQFRTVSIFSDFIEGIPLVSGLFQKHPNGYIDELNDVVAVDVPVPKESLENASSLAEKRACKSLCEQEYVLAATSDFEWVSDSSGYRVSKQSDLGYYRYIGSARSVIIPRKIDGDRVTSYYRMFAESSVTSVANTETVSDLRQMFSGSHQNILDLSLLQIDKKAMMSDMFLDAEIDSGYCSSDQTMQLNELYERGGLSISDDSVFVQAPK